MSKGKTRFGLLGLCVTAAFALMAFVASAAQAAPPEWMLNGGNVSSNTTVTGKITNDTLTILLSKAIGTTIGIDCTEQAISSATLEAGGKAKGTVEFKNCTTELGGKPSTPCKPTVEPIVAGGTLEITLHEKEAVVKATNGALPFATLHFGGTCTLPEEIEVKGTGWILDCEGDPETELLTHLIIEGKLAAEMLGGLKFGAEPASIDGSLIVEVFVGGVMQKFSILAG